MVAAGVAAHATFNARGRATGTGQVRAGEVSPKCAHASGNRREVEGDGRKTTNSDGGD